MTKDELLDEAKRKYPIGTIHKGYYGNDRFTITNELEIRNNKIMPKRPQMGCIYCFFTNKWSKIIYLPNRNKLYYY
jgi:hypothetical protein